MPFISESSMTMPPSHTPYPGVAVAAAAHSDEKFVGTGEAHRLDHIRDASADRTISAGCRSIEAFHTLRRLS